MGDPVGKVQIGAYQVRVSGHGDHYVIDKRSTVEDGRPFFQVLKEDHYLRVEKPMRIALAADSAPVKIKGLEEYLRVWRNPPCPPKVNIEWRGDHPTEVTIPRECGDIWGAIEVYVEDVGGVFRVEELNWVASPTRWFAHLRPLAAAAGGTIDEEGMHRFIGEQVATLIRQATREIDTTKQETFHVMDTGAFVQERDRFIQLEQLAKAWLPPKHPMRLRIAAVLDYLRDYGHVMKL